MPKISSYTTTAPSLTDKLIGTDTTDNSATKNFSVSSVLELSNSNSFNLVLESNTGNDDQTASAINTATTILLGDAKSGTGVALNSAGDITFSTTGTVCSTGALAASLSPILTTTVTIIVPKPTTIRRPKPITIRFNIFCVAVSSSISVSDIIQILSWLTNYIKNMRLM
jgi:hypothetical protein